LVCKRRLWYGSNHWFIDFTKFKQSPKWIVGFSDITVLHNHKNNGYKTIHGIMPVTYPRATTEAVESLKLAFLNPSLWNHYRPYE
jgi:muramoyltetrapeptide carboxypeptidase